MRKLKMVIVAYALLNWGDLITTTISIQKWGASTEVYPLTRLIYENGGFPGLWLSRIALVAFISWAIWRLAKANKIAGFITGGVLIATFAYVVGNNMRFLVG